MRLSDIKDITTIIFSLIGLIISYLSYRNNIKKPKKVYYIIKPKDKTKNKRRSYSRPKHRKRH